MPGSQSVSQSVTKRRCCLRCRCGFKSTLRQAVFYENNVYDDDDGGGGCGGGGNAF